MPFEGWLTSLKKIVVKKLLKIQDFKMWKIDYWQNVKYEFSHLEVGRQICFLMEQNCPN